MGLAAVGLYKRFKRRQVAAEVSLTVEAAEVVGLLGPNGAGKTTTFYMMIGLIAPDRGRILLDEHDITREPIHRRAQRGLSYLPQEASVFRKLSVRDNVLAILELNPRYPTRRMQRQRADALLKELHIDHLAATLGISLSGGERRRTEIARALACDPRFILLDEPFAGVDPIAVADIRAIIAHLCAREIGVLITDHNVRETLKSCERAYILSEGRVITSGTPTEILAHDETRRVYLGESFTLD